MKDKDNIEKLKDYLRSSYIKFNNTGSSPNNYKEGFTFGHQAALSEVAKLLGTSFYELIKEKEPTI